MCEQFEYRQQIKAVVVGNSAVGKTCLLLAYSLSHFPSDVPQTNFDNYMVSMEFEGRKVSVALCDSAGQEMFDRLRPLSYPHTNVFLVCFSVVCRQSFIDVKTKWLPEIQHYCPETPFILVGTKTDLRLDESTMDSCKCVLKGYILFITKLEGECLARSIKAANYVETSARQMVMKLRWRIADQWTKVQNADVGEENPLDRLKPKKDH